MMVRRPFLHIMKKHKPRPKLPTNFRRFKIQRSVPINARDRSNHKFLFSELWKDVAAADKVVTAETVVSAMRHDQPRATFRVTEEWPPGSEPKVIIPPNRFSNVS